jgi:translocation and assembly module TamA
MIKHLRRDFLVYTSLLRAPASIRLLLILLYICINVHTLHAQTRLPVFAGGERTGEIVFKDTLEQASQIRHTLTVLWKQGYLFAAVDSVSSRGLYLYRGSKYPFAQDSRRIDPLKAAEIELRKWTYHGYPFAQIRWDSLRLERGVVRGKPVVEPGPFILNDSLVLVKPVRVRPSYLWHVLDMQDGAPFSERDFRLAASRLGRVPFLKVNKVPDISFQDGKAWMYLDLTEKKTGRFQGVLGMLPNQAAEGKVLFTGAINLHLMNLFASGKELLVDWQGFAEKSQKMSLRYGHPYLLGSRISTAWEFDLLRQDTSFLQQRGKAAFTVPTGKLGRLGLYYERMNAAVLTSNTATIVQRDLQAFSRNIYGVTYATGTAFGQIISAENQWRATFGAGVGEKRMERLNGMPENYYEGVSFRSFSCTGLVELEGQRMLSKATAVYGRVHGGWIQNEEIASTEKFRVGGLMTFRGFNEQFFFVDDYAVGQMEWRQYFEEASYFFAFYDQGIMRLDKWETPLGLGGGFALNTSSGTFNFAMAMGRSRDVPFDLSGMKIHFGYVSVF